MYYNDVTSIIICTNKRAFFQPCPPGTENSGLQTYITGGQYTKNSFCDVNLLAKQSYSAGAGGSRPGQGSDGQSYQYGQSGRRDYDTQNTIPTYDNYQQQGYSSDDHGYRKQNRYKGHDTQRHNFESYKTSGPDGAAGYMDSYDEDDTRYSISDSERRRTRTYNRVDSPRQRYGTSGVKRNRSSKKYRKTNSYSKTRSIPKGSRYYAKSTSRKSRPTSSYSSDKLYRGGASYGGYSTKRNPLKKKSYIGRTSRRGSSRNKYSSYSDLPKSNSVSGYASKYTSSTYSKDTGTSRRKASHGSSYGDSSIYGAGDGYDTNVGGYGDEYASDDEAASSSAGSYGYAEDDSYSEDRDYYDSYGTTGVYGDDDSYADSYTDSYSDGYDDGYTDYYSDTDGYGSNEQDSHGNQGDDYQGDGYYNNDSYSDAEEYVDSAEYGDGSQESGYSDQKIKPPTYETSVYENMF